MNNQQISKIISYFRINHNFHSPFIFLLDGNFLKILVEKGIDLEERLKPLIPGKLRAKVTTCTTTELDMLGHDFVVICRKAKEMAELKCRHAFLPVDRCILEHSLQGQSLIVCSQDKVLRRKLRNKNVGLMYFGPDQRITMEDIERHQLYKDKQAEGEKFRPRANERQKIEEYHMQEQTLQKIRSKKQEFKQASLRGVELKYIKKKIVKAPNPLSIKKKKTSHADSNQPNENSGHEVSSEAPKQKRIRKRNKNKGQQSTEQAADS